MIVGRMVYAGSELALPQCRGSTLFPHRLAHTLLPRVSSL
jgi:hypothetical protein